MVHWLDVLGGQVWEDLDQFPSLVFLGAGAAVSARHAAVERLPTSPEVVRALLSHRYNIYGADSAAAARREALFVPEYRQAHGRDPIRPLTTEDVWAVVLGKDCSELVRYTRVLNSLVHAGKAVPPGYRDVAWLCMRGYRTKLFTTNFDEKLEYAFGAIDQANFDEEHRRHVLTLASDDDFTATQDSPRHVLAIHKLHGTISRPHTIISTNPKLPTDSPRLRALRQAVREADRVLFIGYSLRDEDVADALREINPEEMRRKRVTWVDVVPTDGRFPVGGLTAVRNLLRRWEKPSAYLRVDSQAFLSAVATSAGVRSARLKIMLPRTVENEFLQANPARTLPRGSTPKGLPDAVYGFVRFSDLVGESGAAQVTSVINAGDFQRLRDIRQLSFAHLRFPGANHTRFEHSIGTGFVAAMCLSALRQQRGLNLSDAKVRVTVLAALLHDVGHGPFGHCHENFLARVGMAHRHEQETTRIVAEGIYDLRASLGEAGVSSSDVLNVLGGRLAPEDAFLGHLIQSYALDMDRIDFMLRDLLHSGFQPASFRSGSLDEAPLAAFTRSPQRRLELVRRIAEALRAYPVAGGTDHQRVLAFEPGRLGFPLDDLLSLYCDLYEHVYFDSTVIAAEAMMEKALEVAYRLKEIDPALNRFTDSNMATILEEGTSLVPRTLRYAVRYRRLFVPVFALADAHAPSWLKPDRFGIVEDELADLLRLGGDPFHGQTVIGRIPPKRMGPLFVTSGEMAVPYRTKSYQDRLNRNAKYFVLLSPTKARELTPRDLGRIGDHFGVSNEPRPRPRGTT